ncbi:BTAD domain-containing putative transcriptional regulator [Parafrankia sp. FMc6]|uniref:BTAD domain-containing putative transcriptional regulator n=1 Tax=Parafrankia soli TaxID=2599596 RepID=UPI0034D65A11
MSPDVVNCHIVIQAGNSRPTAGNGERRRGGSGAALLLGLGVGVPVLLLVLTGTPVAAAVGDEGAFTGEFGAGKVLRLMVLAAWLVWIHFMVCVIAEWRAERRQTGLAPRIPFGGGSQALARRLVDDTLRLTSPRNSSTGRSGARHPAHAPARGGSGGPARGGYRAGGTSRTNTGGRTNPGGRTSAGAQASAAGRAGTGGRATAGSRAGAGSRGSRPSTRPANGPADTGAAGSDEATPHGGSEPATRAGSTGARAERGSRTERAAPTGPLRRSDPAAISRLARGLTGQQPIPAGPGGAAPPVPGTSPGTRSAAGGLLPAGTGGGGAEARGGAGRGVPAGAPSGVPGRTAGANAVPATRGTAGQATGTNAGPAAGDRSDQGGASGGSGPATDRSGGYRWDEREAAPRALTAGEEAPADLFPDGMDVKFCEVRPPDGRQYDTLWAIARRLLGNSLRYHEIFALNEGRAQPDGQTLTKPSLIAPGWVLMLPPDAEGEEVRTLRVPHREASWVEEVHARFAAQGSADGRGGTDGAPGGDDIGGGPASTGPLRSGAGGWSDGPEAGQEPSPYGPGIGNSGERSAWGGETGTPGGMGPGRLGSGRGITGAALLAAGVLTALTRRRPGGAGADPFSAEVEHALRLAADLPSARFVDRSLRLMSAGLTSRGRPLPPVYAAILTDAALVLHMAPAVPEPPPAPWQQGNNPGSWRIERNPEAPDGLPFDASASLSADVPAPYPALVTLGRDATGCRILVDLEGAPGMISLVGDPAVASEVAISVAVELATNMWSDDLRVCLVGFADDPSPIAPGRLRTSSSLSDVLDELEARGPRDTGWGNEPGAALRGRQAAHIQSLWAPDLLVLAGPPAPQHAERLARLSGGRDETVGVLMVGDSPAARWRFAVGPDARMSLGVLGVEVNAQTLAAAEYSAVLAMFRIATGARPAEAPRPSWASRRLLTTGADAPVPTSRPSERSDAWDDSEDRYGGGHQDDGEDQHGSESWPDGTDRYDSEEWDGSPGGQATGGYPPAGAADDDPYRTGPYPIAGGSLHPADRPAGHPADYADDYSAEYAAEYAADGPDGHAPEPTAPAGHYPPPYPEEHRPPAPDGPEGTRPPRGSGSIPGVVPWLPVPQTGPSVIRMPVDGPSGLPPSSLPQVPPPTVTPPPVDAPPGSRPQAATPDVPGRAGQHQPSDAPPPYLVESDRPAIQPTDVPRVPRTLLVRPAHGHDEAQQHSPDQPQPAHRDEPATQQRQEHPGVPAAATGATSADVGDVGWDRSYPPPPPNEREPYQAQPSAHPTQPYPQEPHQAQLHPPVPPPGYLAPPGSYPAESYPAPSHPQDPNSPSPHSQAPRSPQPHSYEPYPQAPNSPQPHPYEPYPQAPSSQESYPPGSHPSYPEPHSSEQGYPAASYQEADAPPAPLHGNGPLETLPRLDPDPAGATEAEVHVLGTPSVDAPGRPDRNQIDLLTEIVVFLALHRDGAYPEDVSDLLDLPLGSVPDPRAPGGSGTGVLAGLIAARTWLGVDAGGRPRLQPTSDGRWVLSTDVRCDWELFVAYTHRAARPDDASDPESDLRAALNLVSGPLWSGLPEGRYGWARSTPVESTMRSAVIDAAHRLAMLTLEAGDTVTAMAACRTGLRAAPTAETLWRDLLRTVAARGDRRTLEAVAGELYRTVSAQSTRRGGAAEPETDALVQQLLPGFRRRHH